MNEAGPSTQTLTDSLIRAGFGLLVDLKGTVDPFLRIYASAAPSSSSTATTMRLFGIAFILCIIALTALAYHYRWMNNKLKWEKLKTRRRNGRENERTMMTESLAFIQWYLIFYCNWRRCQTIGLSTQRRLRRALSIMILALALLLFAHQDDDGDMEQMSPLPSSSKWQRLAWSSNDKKMFHYSGLQWTLRLSLYLAIFSLGVTGRHHPCYGSPR